MEKPLGIPPSLISHAEEIRQQDGLNRLRRSMDDTSNLKNSDKSVYDEGVQLLKSEKVEDERARRKYGTDRWRRQPSEIAGQKWWMQVTDIEGYLKSADSSDKLVQDKLRDSERVLSVLMGTNRDLEAYVPSSRRVTTTPQLERELGRLRGCLNEVERQETRRKRVTQALKEKAANDDISKSVLRFPKSTAKSCRSCPSKRDRPSRARISHAKDRTRPIRTFIRRTPAGI